MTPLGDYLAKVANAVGTENGEALATLTDLLMPEEWVSQLLPELSVGEFSTIEARVSSAVPAPLDSYVSTFLGYLQTADPRDFYDAAAAVFAQFCNPVFSRHWHIPVLKRLCGSMIFLALQRDMYLKSLGKKGTSAVNLQNRFSVLMSLILVDRPGFAETKAAALLVANTALRFYIKINEWQLCTKLVRQIDQRRLDLAAYSMSQRVTYHFLVGRLKLYYHKFRAAERHLSFALEHCHARAGANRCRIFSLLVVARMVRGMIPRAYLLEKFQLEQSFGPLIAAYKRGHLAEYDRLLEKNASFFASLGVLYILEHRTRIIMYRNLFRSVLLLSREGKPDAAMTQLDYAQLLRACVFAGVQDMNMASLESIVVALIAQGYMKGYTLPARKLVVVSRNNPFPIPYQLAELRKARAKTKRVVNPPRRPSRRLSMGGM
ncbi:hypothetical protein SpCBS45565_g05523 [Spizellomyces sp. 'palustris']|nr:hypothetical protein SpCBS45565_g05523 [Spizellomyces sp. 'palustris']